MSEKSIESYRKKYAGLLFNWEGIYAAAVPGMIVDLDTGIIIHATSLAHHLFDYIPGELIYKHVSLVIPKRFHEVHQDHFNRYSARPTHRTMGSGNLNTVGARKDGSEFRVTIGLYPSVEQDIRVVTTVILQSGGMTLEQAQKSNPDIDTVSGSSNG